MPGMNQVVARTHAAVQREACQHAESIKGSINFDSVSAIWCGAPTYAAKYSISHEIMPDSFEAVHLFVQYTGNKHGTGLKI